MSEILRLRKDICCLLFEVEVGRSRAERTYKRDAATPRLALRSSVELNGNRVGLGDAHANRLDVTSRDVTNGKATVHLHDLVLAVHHHVPCDVVTHGTCQQ